MTSGHTTAPYAYGITNLSTTTFYPEQGKALSSKALSGASATGSSELAAWCEQAYSYYNAVMSGSEPQPDPASWSEFLNQMSWAQQQLGGGSSPAWGDPSMNGGSTQAGLQPDPFGGMPGTQNNYVYTEEEARIGFVGNGTRDIWSNDVTLDVAPLSAKVTAERTTDTRSTPAEDVIKVTVTDPATGTEAVYFIHDYADATIHINAPAAAAQVTDSTGGLVDIGTFRKSGGTASSEVDAPFEEQDNGDLMVEVPYGQTVRLTPQGGGDDQLWDIYGHFDLSVMPSDVVRVSQVPGDGYMMTVEHKDGSFDTYKIHEGFHGNINGYPENVIWGDPANGGGVGEDIPSAIRGDITLNSAGATGASSQPSTPPDSTDGQTATYNSSENVDIYTDFDDNVTTHDITAPGQVVLHGTSYADTAEVKAGPRPGTYTVLVHHNGSTAPEDTETYIVDGATKIVLDFMPDKISGDKAGDPVIQKGSGDYADTTASDDQQVADQLANVSGIEMDTNEILDKAEAHNIDLTTQSIPTTELYRFLIEIDPVLANLLRSFNGGNDEQRNVLYSQIRDRIVSLFQVIFPNAGVSAVAGSDKEVDNIMFGGQQIDIIDADFNNDNHQTSDSTLEEIFGFEEQN